MIELNSVNNNDAITFLEQLYEDFGDESVNLFLCDLPYTFKGKQRVTANKWDLPINIERFWELVTKMLTKDGAIVLTATNPFASYLTMSNLAMFKYEWIWEKDNGSNFVHVKHQPFKVHEQVLVFGKAPTTYNKAGKYMLYNPQKTIGKPYKVKRSGMTSNLAIAEGYERTDGEYGAERYPRSVLKFNVQKGLHMTQKPTDMFNYFINTYTNKGDTVVDCCVGCGTTAISCIETGRDFVVNDNGIDDRKTSKNFGKYWADITTERIESHKAS